MPPSVTMTALALTRHTKEGREQSKLACYAEANAGVARQRRGG